MTGPVVVAGEALVDLVPQADGALAPMLGGGPFNTARALARLGRPTAFVGCISRDPLGHRLAEALAADGVVLHPRLRTDAPTSLALAKLDPAGVATYGFYFTGTSAPGLAPDVAAAAMPREVAALYTGGLGLVLEPMADAVEALIGEARGRLPIMVDLNIRPGIIADPARYRARLERLLPKVDVLKASDEDLAWLTPGVPVEGAAERLRAAGPRLVLLTQGAAGALALGAFGRRRATSPAVRVADTIGAGDIFSGAWLARWLEQDASLDDDAAIADATAFACRAAAWTCAQAGAAPPTPADLSEWRLCRP